MQPHFTVTVISATNPCLDPDGISQKVNKKGQRITTVQGTMLQQSGRKLP